MTGPEPETTESDDPQEVEVPQVSPAYSTPPPDGPPDADHT